jgi:hypothetical protein
MLATFISIMGIISIIFVQAWWAAVIINISCVPLFYFSNIKTEIEE